MSPEILRGVLRRLSTAGMTITPGARDQMRDRLDLLASRILHRARDQATVITLPVLRAACKDVIADEDLLRFANANGTRAALPRSGSGRMARAWRQLLGAILEEAAEQYLSGLLEGLASEWLENAMSLARDTCQDAVSTSVVEQALTHGAILASLL